MIYFFILISILFFYCVLILKPFILTQVTFQGLYIVFSVMFGALADVFGGARIMGLVVGLWFLPSILFLLVTLWFVCFFRPRFSLVWFSLIYLIPWAALQYLWDGIMTLLTPRQIHQTTITILVLPTVFGLAQSLTFPSMNVLLSRYSQFLLLCLFNSTNFCCIKSPFLFVTRFQFLPSCSIFAL